MDVYLMIRRKKLTIFLDTKDNNTVLELKRMIHGILPEARPEDQTLYTENQVMEDGKTLAECHLNPSTAKAQAPAPIGLALRDKKGDFEPLDITPYSTPPELPDVMKSPDSNGQEQVS